MDISSAGLVRQRVRIFDAGFVLVVIAVFAWVALQVDLFRNVGGPTQEQTIEVDELFGLTTLLMCGILFYAWRRAREHRHENDLRLAAESEVLHLAMQDPLTGLPNRRRFDKAIGAALAELPVPPEAHAVLLLDLNGFKKINDVYGHPTGDQVLIHVGARLLRAVREGDLVARLGGDEFVILARNVAGAEDATNVALRVIEELAPPIAIGQARHQVGTAIGIAMGPADATEAQELLRKADVALYRAKAKRESSLRFFEEEMDQHLRERDELERAIGPALEHGEFALSYRPSRQAGGMVSAFEALPRWDHPAMGEIGPDRFLPIAAKAGLLAAVTEKLLATACAAACDWDAPVRLAFGLPAALLPDTAFGARILEILAEAGLSPSRLQLDIDERALTRDAIRAAALLEPLQAAGVNVVADHFGTGYSDLANLSRLRLNGVKIDRSYVAAMAHDRQAAVMVRALIGIGQGLDLAVTAEGAVPEEQREALEAQGCALAQGASGQDGLTAEEASALTSGGRPA
nr:EAL domain-containing protein [uncultured Roseococcus sp.]